MKHSFVSNDNKGNVNSLEISATETKIKKVVDPVEEGDAVNKKYVDERHGPGSSLPPVTNNDNGKVLAVEDGAWVARDNIFPITFTYNEEGDSFNFVDVPKNLYDNAERTAIKCNMANMKVGKYSDAIKLVGDVIFTYYTNIIEFSDMGKSRKYFKYDDIGSGYMFYIVVEHDEESVDGHYYIATFFMVPKKAVAHLTLTSDIGGTMDVTNRDLYEYSGFGAEIYFNITMDDVEHEILAALKSTVTGIYPGFVAEAVDTSGTLIQLMVFPSHDESNEFVIRSYSLSPGKYTVTLTPIAFDYSGNMDCSVADILSAYIRGYQIEFKFSARNGIYIYTTSIDVISDPDYNYPSFRASFVDVTNDLYICVSTMPTNDNDKITYSTKIYPLTLPSAQGVSF